MYRLLFAHFGPQHWWPGRSQFEVCVGAILTQNAAWSNVERAIANLRRARVLSPRAIRTLSRSHLAALIRPSGYFRVKERRLRSFVDFLWRETRGDVWRLMRAPTPFLRNRLLLVHGIGPETADSMLLYAGGHPVFVVDAYTRRVMARHGWAQADATYDELQEIFHAEFLADAVVGTRIPADNPATLELADFFNEYHALIVAVGKQYCRPREPRCEECPLKGLLPRGGPLL